MTLFFPDLEAKYRREERAKIQAEMRVERAAIRAWDARMQEAKRKGEPFNEPPPWMSEEDGDADDGQ